jgi:hypothetical protein
MSILPEGTYRAKAIDYAVGEAGTGTQQIGVACQIVQGPAANQVRTWYGFFSDDAIEVTIKAMRAMGWATNSLDDLDEILRGKEFDIVIEHEADKEDPRKMRDRIRWINAGGVAMKKKLNGAEIALLNKKISGVAARLGGGSRQPAQQQGEWRGNRRTEPAHDPRAGDRGGAPWDDAPPPSDRDAPAPRSQGGQRWR